MRYLHLWQTQNRRVLTMSDLIYGFALSLGQPQPQKQVSLKLKMNLRPCCSCYYLPCTYLDTLLRISSIVIAVARVAAAAR